jgi:hypothetical protein
LLTSSGVAIQFLSSGATAITQAAAASQTATVTLVENKWVKIAAGKFLVDNVTIATKVEGTDFQVHYGLGLIMALNSGAAGSKSVGYDVLELDTSADIIVGGSKPAGVQCSLLYPCRRLDTGAPAELYIPKVNLIPNGSINFANQEEQEVTFTGAPVTQTIAGVQGFFSLRNLPEA